MILEVADGGVDEAEGVVVDGTEGMMMVTCGRLVTTYVISP